MRWGDGGGEVRVGEVGGEEAWGGEEGHFGKGIAAKGYM